MAASIVTNPECPVCFSQHLKPRYEFDWGRILQCVDCSCAFTQGCDVESENKAAFSNGDNDESMTLYRQWARERLLTLRRFVNGGSLLEFGPGTGEFLFAAASAGFSAVGVDQFPRIRSENQIHDVSTIQADARTFIAASPFDVVAALHVLEHFSNPYELMESIRRNVSPSGFVLLEVPNFASLSRAVAGRRWSCLVSYHALQLSPASIGALMKKAGFRILHLETVGCSTTQLLGVGLPSLGRRLGVPVKYGWEPGGVLRRVATSLERPLHWGYNLRLVAQKV